MKMSQTGGNATFPQIVKGRLLVLLLAISFIMLSGPTRAQAQAECVGKCEETLAACLNTSRDPVAEAICIANYWTCVDGCLGSYAAIMG